MKSETAILRRPVQHARHQHRAHRGQAGVKRTEIDGRKVVHEFTALWHEWELDGCGWVTDDGRAWLSTTRSGDPHEVKADVLVGRLDEALLSVDGLRRALALTGHDGLAKARLAGKGYTVAG